MKERSPALGETSARAIICSCLCPLAWQHGAISDTTPRPTAEQASWISDLPSYSCPHRFLQHSEADLSSRDPRILATLISHPKISRRIAQCKSDPQHWAKLVHEQSLVRAFAHLRGSMGRYPTPLPGQLLSKHPGSQTYLAILVRIVSFSTLRLICHHAINESWQPASAIPKSVDASHNPTQFNMEHLQSARAIPSIGRN